MVNIQRIGRDMAVIGKNMDAVGCGMGQSIRKFWMSSPVGFKGSDSFHGNDKEKVGPATLCGSQLQLF